MTNQNKHEVILALSILFLGCVISCTRKKEDGQYLVAGSLANDTASISKMIRKANEFDNVNLDSMHQYAARALREASRVGFRQGIARAMGVEANYQRRKGNYASAISLGLEVIKMYDSIGMWERQVKMLNILADIYKEMGEANGTLEFFAKALDLAQQAQGIAEENNYSAGIVMTLNQRGVIHRSFSKAAGQRKYMDTAMAEYQKAIKIIAETGKGEDDLVKLYNNISQVYNEYHKDYPKALEWLFKAVAYNTERNSQNGLSHNYGNISNVYLRVGDYSKAKNYGHQMLAISERLNAPERKINAYGQLKNVAKALHEYDSALYYHELEVQVSDSLNNVRKTAQITEMQTRYETAKKESRIIELSELNEVKNNRLWLVAGGASLMAVLVILFIFQNRRLQQQKKQITIQSERLGWMMKELHHRVKNNLQIVSSLLSLQTYRLKDQESISALKESQLRVQAMSLIHQRLYQVQDVSMVNFKLYLNDLVETLMKAYGYNQDDFDLIINIDKEFLDVDTVMPMGLLVNEIITNSFKYAYRNVSRPLLTIHLKTGEGQLNLSIADNGPGMEDIADRDIGSGFGKKLIDALTKQLKANYTLNNSSGAAYLFTIPYSKEKAA